MKAECGNEPTCVVGEGARLEASSASETIDSESASSVRSQSFTEEVEAGEEPVKPDRTR